MKTKNVKRDLSVFLEVSKLQVESYNKAIKRLEKKKSLLSSRGKTYVNEQISELSVSRDETLGHLDSVRLELLDVIAENPELISAEMLAKKGHKCVATFVEAAQTEIRNRGLSDKYPFSIADVLTIGLSETAKPSYEQPSLFRDPVVRPRSTKDVEMASKNREIVKTMIKTL